MLRFSTSVPLTGTSSVTGNFLLPVWLTQSRFAGCDVLSGRTSGNKERSSTREDYVIFFLLAAHHSFHPLIPAAEPLPEDIAVSLLCPLLSASWKCHTLGTFRGLFTPSSAQPGFHLLQELRDCLSCADTCQGLSWRNSSESAFLCWKMQSQVSFQGITPLGRR